MKSPTITYLLKKAGLFALMIILFSEYSIAQVSVRATVEPPQIMIGQQALINLQVITPKDKLFISRFTKKRSFPVSR